MLGNRVLVSSCSRRCGASVAAATVMTGTTTGALVTQQRFLEYWGLSVTGRTQPYAQGDMLPRLDNTGSAIDKSTGAAAALTGNHTGIAYDSSNIFNVEGFSELERQHYKPLRGIDKYKIEPIQERDGPAAVTVMKEMMEPEVEASLQDMWWGRVLKDFPSMKKPCTPAFCKAWEDFYMEAMTVASDEAAVTALSKPFVCEQMQKNYISYAMIWRLAERLGDALVAAPHTSKYEKRAARFATERVTKIMLNTIADEPWAIQETTSPLHVEVSNFRAWHEAGNW